jgi:protein-S-isoprenylcysteine O-methyltransferase Ste14
LAKKRAGLGSEHPYCDTMQFVMLVIFFGVWATDFLSFFVFGYSTILIGLLPIPVNLALAAATLVLSSYLEIRSHEAIFNEEKKPPGLIDLGVYSWVRHPMYLGVLMFCLGFFFISLSLISFLVWVMFFIFYDRMATCEEKDLIRIFGEKYLAYQKRVPKWFPRMSLKR